MRLKPYTIKPPAIKRIDIKIAEYDGIHYKGSKSISVYETTVDEIYKKILEMLKDE